MGGGLKVVIYIAVNEAGAKRLLYINEMLRNVKKEAVEDSLVWRLVSLCCAAKWLLNPSEDF